MTNSRCKIAFGGWLNLDTVWKSGSLKPTVIGSEKITLHAEAQGETTAKTLAIAKSRMRASAAMHSASTASIAAALADEVLPEPDFDEPKAMPPLRVVRGG